MNPKIRHDKSATSIVSTCSACEFWYAFNWDIDGARNSGARHLEIVHDIEPRVARGAIHKAAERARHAANS